MAAENKKQFIRIRGANENNLKNLSVDIPRDKFVVLTGLSGSGKSSLAFDTIYAEGQRRYMESLSSYARQFLGQMEKPDVESIEGLPPAISIDQKSTNRNPRSTVGTVTEIYDYFRLLYARIGIPHCPKCGREIQKQSVDQMAQRLIDVTQQSFFEGIRFAREGQRLSDISAAVQKYVEDNGYSVVREYVGHGIGRKMHESPEVPNFGAPGHGPRLLRGMTIAVEPMVNAGGAAVRVMPDGWTVKTQDGSLAAHYENTILITNGEAELLTLPEI